MPDQITGGGQPDGTAHAYPIAQEAHDSTPVINIPPNAVPPGMATAPHPYEQQTSTIVVDGQSRTVNQQELIALAQKGVSSDERFQDAAAQAKENAEAIAFWADMQLVAETADISAFRRSGAALGLTGDETEEAARIVFEQMGESMESNESFPNEAGFDDRPRATPQDGSMNASQKLALLETELAKMKAQLASRVTTYGDLDLGLQTAILDVEQARVDRIIQKALDSDQVLAYHMNSYDDKGRAAVRGLINEKVKGRLDASDDGRFGDGARILQDVVPEVRDLLEATGTPNRSIPPMGLGPAPGGQGAEIYPTKQPDHVSSAESGFEEHIAETLRHNIFKAQQGGG